MPHPLLIFSHSNYLIQAVDTIQIFNGKQCRSRSVGFFRSQLIWIYTVCNGRAYQSSAGLGLIYSNFCIYPKYRHVYQDTDLICICKCTKVDKKYDVTWSNWVQLFKASLTSSLRVISLTVLADSIYNIVIFFAEKM